MDNSGDFSDELDEYEDSRDEANLKKRPSTTVANKPYDEAYELSADLSTAESYDGKGEKIGLGLLGVKMKNDKYDEAVDLSQSLDNSNAAVRDSRSPQRNSTDNSVRVLSEPSSMKDAPRRDSDHSQNVPNRPFDEALEFSQSGSDDSVDTKQSDKRSKSPTESKSQGLESKGQGPSYVSGARNGTGLSDQNRAALNQQNIGSKQALSAQQIPKGKDFKTSLDDADESSDEEDNKESSYENIVGAYDPTEYISLNVTAEVRDLFQYIERYKPHEVELESTLKCFIPEYIPAIGEMDAFIKVPRPDKKEEDLGLKFLDEPCGSQSDPTVLELQLRAMSKKLQYGDVVVRSIEDASKNPVAIEKWIQSIGDLHRSKPPPQVHYKGVMPDIDSLLDVWPEEFEQALKTLKLPSPDLDLSLLEYSKTLCAILDIPTYDNPIESLHQMFSLYMDFRNNPHLQARDYSLTYRDRGGAADIMNVDPAYK